MDLFIAALAASPMAAIFSLCVRSTHQRLNELKPVGLAMPIVGSGVHSG